MAYNGFTNAHGSELARGSNQWWVSLNESLVINTYDQKKDIVKEALIEFNVDWNSPTT